jgi:hypothetical protein
VDGVTPKVEAHQFPVTHKDLTPHYQVAIG